MARRSVSIATAPAPVRRHNGPSCYADTEDSRITFENPFDTVEGPYDADTYETIKKRIEQRTSCTQAAAYRAGKKYTCRQHLCVLIDEDSTNWIDGMVPVTVLESSNVTS